MICEKYIVRKAGSGHVTKNSKADKKLKRIDKIREGFFHFHIDTGFLAKNMHRINPDTIISVSEKIHGSSFISSYISCNKKLNFLEKIFVKARRWAEK